MLLYFFIEGVDVIHNYRLGESQLTYICMVQVQLYVVLLVRPTSKTDKTYSPKKKIQIKLDDKLTSSDRQLRARLLFFSG